MTSRGETDELGDESAGGAEAPIRVTGPYLLLVEGKDEVNFFEALSRSLGLEGLQVLGVGGRLQFRPHLKTVVDSPLFRTVVTSLGVARDSDASPPDTFKSVCDALSAANLPAPPACLTPAGGAPRVTVFLLPGPDAPGMLEDLCLESVAGDPATACVDQLFDCLEHQGQTPPHNVAKARVQAFLASREVPGLRLGEAAGRGYWPFDSTSFEQAKAFLRQLCS